MNMLLRLLWMIFASRRRSPVPPLGPCRTPLRVWLTDLDLLGHVNNGIYLTMMDLGRLDMSIRSGTLGAVRKADWYPVVVAETIQFRRSLNLFERFEIETRVLGWDEKAILIEQQFFRGEEAVAHSIVRARFLSKKGGTVTPEQVVTLLGINPASPPLPEYAQRWNLDQAGWQGARRS